MRLKSVVRKFLRSVGYDIYRYPPLSDVLINRRRLIRTYEIDLVLDVGANAGQFAQQLRHQIGYTKEIISFEPVRSAFEALTENAKGDGQWQCMNFALGDVNENKIINLAGNSYSSSLLNMLPSHAEAAPDSSYIGQETINIQTLDFIFDDIRQSSKNIYLKIDTQGFEDKVLKGAEASLQYIDTIQVEMSLTPLYESELLFHEMRELLNQKGYVMVAIEPGFYDRRSRELLQVDGIFHRK